MAPLSRLDHVVIAVRNLDEAAATYRKLGLTLTPRGLHEGKGTGNHCIMFPTTYVELLGVVDATGAEGRLAQRVAARGEGGIAVAYGADDADKVHTDLRAAGIDAEDPNELSRPLDLDGKREMVRFRNVMMPGLTLPDTMQFVCTHLTPGLTRARHEWQLHPSGATGIAEIVVAADDPARYVAEMTSLFGSTKTADGDISHNLQNARLTVANRSKIEARFGAKALQGAPQRGIVALTIRVNEPDAAAAMLEMAKVPHRETKRGIIVPASVAHGVVIEFAES